MSEEPSLILQGAINAALRASNVADSAIYDAVPNDAQLPYISFGPSQVIDNSTNCYASYEVFQQLDVWSDGAGFVECKQIAGEVVNALSQLQETDTQIIIFEHETTRYFRDSELTISHGVVSVRAIIEPTKDI